MIKRLLHRPFSVVAALLLFSINMALAAEDQGGSKAENLGPVVMLQDVTHQLLARMEQNSEQIKKDDSYLMGLANEVLLKHFDTRAMSRWVLGEHWKSATDEQQQQFVREFQMLVIRFYISALFDDPELLDEIIEMGDRVITYEPLSWDASTKKVAVKSIFSVPGGLEIPLKFKLYYSKRREWLIYDINVDGISLITNYRNSFGAEIRNDGLDVMLERLTHKNREQQSATR